MTERSSLLVKSPLEDAASECMELAKNATNIWFALIAQNCALAIRKLPGWNARTEDKDAVIK